MDQPKINDPEPVASTAQYVGGRLDVQQIIEHYTAGRIATVPIVIRNPFDRPISIRDVIIPNSTFVTAEPRIRRPLPTSKKNDGLGQDKRSFDWRRVFKVVGAAVASSAMHIAGLSLGIHDEPIIFRMGGNKVGRTLNISAQEGSTVDYNVPDEAITEINVSANENATVRINPVAQQAVDSMPPTIIPPHCEIVETFGFRAGNWLWSQPTTINTNIQIDYEFDGARKTQVVPITATVRPPPAAIILGAVFGAVVGCLARGASPFERATMLTALTSIFMAIIAAIGLSRKSGSQGVVTVEDFYGGFLVGALIGYGGPAVFERTVGNVGGILGKPATAP